MPMGSDIFKLTRLVRRFGGYLAVVAVLIGLPGVPSAAAEQLQHVSLLPQWIPQAQFAGYMTALEKGFYREAGLEVKLLRGGPGRLPFEILQNKRTTFVTGWLSTGIEKRAAGLKVVNLAQIIQESSLMLVTRRSSGIKAPRNLTNKRVGIWGGHFLLPLLVFFHKNALPVTTVDQYQSINLFLKDGVDAASAMAYNEYHLILNSGLNADELNTFFLRDYGVNFPEDGLYCLEETYASDPDMCRRFVEASIKGWLYAFDHPAEAIDIVMEQMRGYNVGVNRAHQRWMLDRMREVIIPDGDRSQVGRLDPEAYRNVAHCLNEFGWIQSVPPISEFYKGRP